MFHEEFESHGQLVLFRCRECGYTSMSLGGLHAHAEKHRGYTRLNIQVPFTQTSPANADELMKPTNVIRVDDTTEIGIEEVDGL